MATVVNRKTGEILYSVNTPDFPEADFIINPELSAVKDVPAQYLKIEGDQVKEITAAEKAAIDAAAPKPVSCPITGKDCYATNQ